MDIDRAAAIHANTDALLRNAGHLEDAIRGGLVCPEYLAMRYRLAMAAADELERACNGLG